MNTLVAPHLEQISSAAAGIAAFQFGAPKIFTNAILRSRDIVSLIRDTDVHERALFTVPSPAHGRPTEPNAKPLLGDKTRLAVAPRRNTAVYSVLGGDMIEQLRRGGAGGVEGGIGGIATNEVDVELLLLGAEKLVDVYHIQGATRRIEAARERFDQLTESITNYEALVEAQRSQLDLINHSIDVDYEIPPPQPEETVTEEMIEQEEEAIRKLEQRREQMELKIENIDRQMSSVYRNL
ncbi:DASH complex, subunit Spc34 [Wilcoxina mikolae CBS 423.85]|nr:DASH complex, subunit Spc34 [Wilcoxina mikolae CBS 423.85]